MDIEEEITQAAQDAAWSKFQRMTSSNPGDYANAITSALMPLVRRVQAEAWFEGADAAVHGYDLPDASEIHNPYIEQGAGA